MTLFQDNFGKLLVLPDQQNIHCYSLVACGFINSILIITIYKPLPLFCCNADFASM